MNRILYFLLTWLILTYSFGNCKKSETLKQPDTFTKGVLDLSNTNLDQEKPIILQGEWEFYWKEFVEYTDNEETVKKKFTGYFAPGETWRAIAPENPPTGFGYATYRLKIKFSEKDLGKSLVFRLFHAGGAAQKLFINEKPMLELGKIGTSREAMIPTRQGGMFVFPVSSTEILVTLHISNYYHYDGAFWYPPELSLEQNFLKFIQRKQAEDSFIWGCIFLIFFHHLSIYLRRNREKSYLYFSIYSFLILLQLISFTNIDFIYLLFPDVPHRITFIISLNFILIMPFYLLFMKTVFPLDFSNRWIYSIGGICFGLFAILLIFPTEISSLITLPCLFMTLVSIVYSLFGVVCATIKGRKYSKAMLFTLVLIFLGAVNDMLHSYNLINTKLLIKYAYLISVILQSTLISIIFTDTITREEKLSLDLRELNESLEEKIEDRTKELAEEKEKAITANLWKDKFLTLVSHDLRSPMASVYSSLDLLLDEEISKEEKTGLFESVKSVLKNSMSMVHHLLSLSRFQSTAIELYYSDVNVHTMLKDQYYDFAGMLSQKKLKFSNQIPEDTILTVDEKIFGEVIRNLILNAIKFTKPEGEIIAKYEERDGFQIVTIQDSGVGISKEKMEKLFSGESSSLGTSGERGFGVGLKLCKELIELHNGKLEVKSELNIGSSFQILIPTNENLGLFVTKSKKWEKNIGKNFLITNSIFQALSMIRRIHFKTFMVDKDFSEEEIQKLREEILKQYNEEKEILKI